MPSATVEDYLKQICLLQKPDTTDLVPMGQLSASMGVAPGTATAMIKTLANSKLIEYEPRSGVRLSQNGHQLALHVLRRHRLVEQLLVEVLGLDWSEVHEEAEQLEHAISDAVLEKIDEVLGHPSVDPHGDPIPSAKGRLERPTLLNMSQLQTGQQGRIARVIDQNATFLKFVERHGLTPGADFKVDHCDESADAVTVQPTGKGPVTIGSNAAAKIFVERA